MRPKSISTDTIDLDYIQRLEERLIALDRNIAKHHQRILDKTERLVATNSHSSRTLRSHTQALASQSSTIDGTRHIVTAQARTISSQARKIASQQELIEVMQRDIFRLSRWNTESNSRINAHDEALISREDDIRKVSAGLEDHIRFFEYIEKETYWMNVYSKQMMMLRATELENAAAATNDDERSTDTSTMADDINPSPIIISQHILLDRIVVHMVKEHASGRLQNVIDGFEAVHGVSLHSYEDLILGETTTETTTEE
ncbi:hypothetical protein UA08_01320 [Talaromyces atroroseus]|uniref:Uncharacterized protein n=1 Tax=Talaromyces atroroseus TaxID=1441469 RepID=A0A1Q5QAD5_TALAT|nr:hypothetical protein UA08_01320 [Talaromyces atroroseus]OKL62768.1 hypothetical protein UA08_01320 [Talaromyces atroroseus]